MFQKPILFLIFNRPENTQKVFQEIRSQKPRYLFIAADGPRKNKPGDAELCEQARAVAANIDWDCEVKTLFRSENLGCGAGPANAISWFFDQVDEGIILEDDCIPNASFFSFCKELLDKYKENPQVMMVCGTSYQPAQLDQFTYYFSRYPHAWGWATWKRAWMQYKFELDGESIALRKKVISKIFFGYREKKLWLHNFKMITNGLDAWDYQWMYWIWKNNGVCATPWLNTVANVGFGPQATHTFDERSSQAAMKQNEIFTIIHPPDIEIHKQADRYERFHILIDSNSTYYRKRFFAGINRLRKLLNLHR